MFWYKLIFATLLTILLLTCMIGLRFGIIMNKFKIKRKYAVIFLLALSVLIIFCTVWFALFKPRAVSLLFICLGCCVIEIIFLLVTLKDKHKFGEYMACSFLSMMLIPIIFSVMITQINSYNHTIVYDYEISIIDNEVIAEYDEDLPGFKKIVNETVANMKKYGSTYYKGSVEVEYKCMYPPFKNLHESNCTCTDREICDACREHAFREGTIKEVNID